ncbi:TPA: hypothetical protein RTG57_001783 [Campylobacter jejuni]|nr:hypothetical protein [Campylobacter jejuni]
MNIKSYIAKRKNTAIIYVTLSHNEDIKNCYNKIQEVINFMSKNKITTEVYIKKEKYAKIS